MKIPEMFRDLYRIALEQGWTVTFTGRDHLKWSPPRGAGRPVFSSQSPSDVRAVHKHRTQLRRAGLKI